MNFDIAIQDKRIQKMLNKAWWTLIAPQRKKMFKDIAVAVQKDIHWNFDHDRTYDDQRMPKLTATTWRLKNLGMITAKSGKRKGKRMTAAQIRAKRLRQSKSAGSSAGRVIRASKLYVTGLLQKIRFNANADRAIVWSPADYALALNERSRVRPWGGKSRPAKPFKFMGFGKRVLGKIDKILVKHIFNKIR